MDTILITGGTGLVGSRLLGRFVAAGKACRALARPGRALPDGVEVAEADILSPETLEAAVSGVSAIVHLAASFRSGNDAETWRVNLDGTRNLIAAVRAHAPTARFVMASTSNVYDDDAPHPSREDDELHPTHAYPASKVQAEEALRSSDLTWAVLRLPFVYGEGDGHLRDTPARLRQMHWHPAQRLSVAHHRDIAAAFELALTGAMDGLVVNIADDAPLSVYEMAALAGQTYPESNEAVVNPWRGVVDSSRARGLGFSPTIRTAYQALGEGRL